MKYIQKKCDITILLTNTVANRLLVIRIYQITLVNSETLNVFMMTVVIAIIIIINSVTMKRREEYP